MVIRPAESGIELGVPYGMRVAAAWCWRLVVIAIAFWALAKVVDALYLVIVPTAIALLLAALLQPVVTWLRRHGVPPSIAAALVLVAGLATVIAVLAAVVRAFVQGFTDLSDNVEEGIQQIRDWLKEGPLDLSNEEIDSALKTIAESISENRTDITQGALDTATTVGHILTGFFLVLFTTFFLLKDGSPIWTFLMKLLPSDARAPVDQAGHYAWQTLIAYVRASVLVAAVDAVGIGAAVWLLGVPLALPLAALVFLTSFIPILGATLSGAVAVLVALVTKGPVVALLVLAAVIAVQQLEGHVLQPLLLGRAVAIHPLAVILAISAGLVAGGLIGALLSVPVVAVLNTTIRYLVQYRDTHSPPARDPAPS